MKEIIKDVLSRKWIESSSDFAEKIIYKYYYEKHTLKKAVDIICNNGLYFVVFYNKLSYLNNSFIVKEYKSDFQAKFIVDKFLKNIEKLLVFI